MLRITWPLLLVGCAASTARSCCNYTPPIPDPPVEETGEEDSEQDDTSDTVDTVDTTPPPPCAQPEVEPNFNESNATFIEMESYACGFFESANDFDVYAFEMEEVSWLKIDVDAVERGSSGNPILTVESESGLAAISLRGPRSNDPLLVFPVNIAEQWVVRLTEAQGGFGEDYDYKLIATATKEPVEWTGYEADQNDELDEAQLITEGEVIYGIIDSSVDFDWYRVDTPEGRNQITVQITGQGVGSPLFPRLQLYTLEENSQGELVETLQGTFDESGDSASQDPKMVRVSDGGETWYFKVRHRPGTQNGDLYWYVIETRIE